MQTIGDSSPDQVRDFSKEAFGLFYPGADPETVADSSDSDQSGDEKTPRDQGRLAKLGASIVGFAKRAKVKLKAAAHELRPRQPSKAALGAAALIAFGAGNVGAHYTGGGVSHEAPEDVPKGSPVSISAPYNIEVAQWPSSVAGAVKAVAVPAVPKASPKDHHKVHLVDITPGSSVSQWLQQSGMSDQAVKNALDDPTIVKELSKINTFYTEDGQLRLNLQKVSPKTAAAINAVLNSQG